MKRRLFFKWAGITTLPLTISTRAWSSKYVDSNSTPLQPEGENYPESLYELEQFAKKGMGEDALLYLNGGADDLLTIKANMEAYRKIQIRARRLVDVRTISTQLQLFGKALDNPILLSPVANQRYFHAEGEIATAKAAKKTNHTMIASSLSNFSINEIVKESNADVWFQLYPSPVRDVTKRLIERAESAGCKVLVLTVDSPVVGKREKFSLIDFGILRKANYEGILPEGVGILDAGMTWNIVDWLKKSTKMRIVLKGIVTHEDAHLAYENGADGIIVSNHGGRQLESNRATIDCLSEIIDTVKDKIPVLIDGGIRRGTDIFKALALGAKAVCIGRPFCWGLGAYGQRGVELALGILREELIRDMKLAGTPALNDISLNHITYGPVK
ncbi:MAG: alpha-hydroxy-acid oxidizing protein [Chitinophagaceae bacterium]|nr:alpha-hydroxy-acid oxidizing protein [Chitinophagaceae bacterium]MCW5927311.1 alpha-hydroxy-acid oxidizing protein [Chitinophagaceae bacterium]